MIEEATAQAQHPDVGVGAKGRQQLGDEPAGACTNMSSCQLRTSAAARLAKAAVGAHQLVRVVLVRHAQRRPVPSARGEVGQVFRRPIGAAVLDHDQLHRLVRGEAAPRVQRLPQYR